MKLIQELQDSVPMEPEIVKFFQNCESKPICDGVDAPVVVGPVHSCQELFSGGGSKTHIKQEQTAGVNRLGFADLKNWYLETSYMKSFHFTENRQWCLNHYIVKVPIDLFDTQNKVYWS